MERGPVAVRLLKTYDVERLRQDLAACERFAWVPETDGGDTSDHVDWDVMPLSSRGGRMDDGSAGTNSLQPFRATSLLDHTPYFREVLESLGAPLRSVRVSAIRPGGRIQEHSDTDVCAVESGDQVRLHVPIVTNDDVVFLIDGQQCTWKPGELWYGDFSRPHSVENRGSATRVHLLAVVEVNEHVLSLFPPEFLAGKDIKPRRREAQADALRARVELDGRLQAAREDLEALLEGLPPDICQDLRRTFSGLLRFRFVGDRLTVTVDGDPMFHLEPETDSRWRVTDMDAHVDFVPGAAQQAATLTIAKLEQRFQFPIQRV